MADISYHYISLRFMIQNICPCSVDLNYFCCTYLNLFNVQHMFHHNSFSFYLSSFQAGPSPPGYLPMTPGVDGHSQVCVTTSYFNPIAPNSFSLLIFSLDGFGCISL